MLLPLLAAWSACLAGCASATSDGPGADGALDGTALFERHCAPCHGEDGRRGLGGAKDLGRSVLVREEVMAQVAAGRGMMMGYRDILTPRQLDLVVDHVMTLRADGPPARP